MKSGVYAIRNLLNGMIYIGSSVHIKNRWRSHLSRLGKGKHHCPHLQHAWNKYGAQAFVFELLENCEADQCSECEQRWLDIYFQTGNCYNAARYAGKPTLGIKRSAEVGQKIREANTGRKHTPETRQKMSKSQTGRKLTPEQCRANSERQRGKAISIEQRQKLSKALTGRIQSQETIRKRSAALKGKPRSKEVCRKISEAKKGKPLHPNTIRASAEARKGKPISAEHRRKISKTYEVSCPNGELITVRGLKPFCKAHGLDLSTLLRTSTGKQSHHKGFKCRRLPDGEVS
jgi:group I intron endonuclease